LITHQQVQAASISSLTPVSHWTFDETSGVRYDSSTTSTNDLTDNNTVSYATGLLGNAADFERSNTEYFSITDANQIGLDFSNSFTLSYWIKKESDVQANLINKWIGSTGQRSYTFEFGSGYISGAVSENGANNIGKDVSGLTYTTNWQHHCFIIDNTRNVTSLKVNGSHVGTSTATAFGTIFNGTAPFQIGAGQGASATFDGLLDEFSIFARALSTSECSTLYNSGVPLPYNEPEPELPSICVYDTISTMNPIQSLTCTVDGATTTCEYGYGVTTTPVWIESDDFVFIGGVIVFILTVIFAGFVFSIFRQKL